MASETRERMVGAAVVALQRRGMAGMSFTEILTTSGAARGAIYHHFPGGKSQLVAEAAARNGADVRAQLATLPAVSPPAVVRAFLAAVRPVIAAATTGCGCAVAAVTVGLDPDGDALYEVAAAAFASWTQVLGERLRVAGVKPTDADDLATALIALLEGAQVLCRAARGLAPFEQAARMFTALVDGRYPAG